MPISDEVLDLEVFLAVDCAQAEIRALAELSQDPVMIKLLLEAAKDRKNKKKDFHALNGHMLTGRPIEQIATDENLRRSVKNLIFGIIFGKAENGMYEYVVQKIRAVEGKNADLTGITKASIAVLYKKFFSVYGGVRKWIEKQRALGDRLGYVETLFGFRRHIRSDDTERKTFTGNQSINCVDFDTEILTQRGWLSGMDLKKTDMCLTETGWQRPVKVNRFLTYTGPLHVWDNRSFSSASTPNHRWKTKGYYGRGKVHPITKIRTSDELQRNGVADPFIINRTIPEVEVAEIYSDDFIRLCGWVLTDGYFSCSNKTAVGVCQSKPKTKAIIQKLMNRLGISTGYEDTQCYWYVGGPIGKSIRTLFPRRLLSIEFISSLSRRQANMLIDTMVMGDGCRSMHKTKDGNASMYKTTMCCGNCRNASMATAREKADAFQALCAWAGYATSSKPKKQKKPAVLKNGQIITAGHTYYLVTILRRTNAHILRKHEKIRKGKGVWCPSFADDAAWVARRKGYTYITKNSPVQGSAHTYMLIALALLDLKPITYSRLLKCIMEVHDALYFKVKLRYLVEAHTQLIKLFETDTVEYARRAFGLKLRVPLLVDSKAGFCMGSMVTYEGEPVEAFLKAWRIKQAETDKKSWEDLMPATED